MEDRRRFLSDFMPSIRAEMLAVVPMDRPAVARSSAAVPMATAWLSFMLQTTLALPGMVSSAATAGMTSPSTVPGSARAGSFSGSMPLSATSVGS